MDNKLKRKAGFTAIELSIVVAVVALLATIGIPNIVSSLPKHRLKIAVRDIASNIQSARLKPISEVNDYVVLFNPGQGSYTVFSDNGRTNAGADGIWGTPDDTIDTSLRNDGNQTTAGEAASLKTVNLSDYLGVSFGFGDVPVGDQPASTVTFTNNRARFRANGALRSVSGGVYLQNAQNNAMRITVLSATGRVRLESWYGTSWE